MNIKHLNQLIIVSLFLALSSFSSAQMHFKYSAVLDTVKQSGFYRILLSENVLAKCNRNFADLRIFDNDGNPDAYILQTDGGAVYTKPMIDLPIIKKEKEADKQWHITLENSQKRSIDRINLKVNENDTKRLITISGSEDNKHWYAITENFYAEITMFSPDEWFLYFPSNNYKYFQMTLLGKDLLPVDIIKASIFSNKVIAPKYSCLSAPHRFIQKDSSNKKSYVKIFFDEPYPIEKISLKVPSAKYFKRHLAIHNSLESTPLFDTVLSSFNNEYPTIQLSCKEKDLWLVIDNDDNKPLKIEGIDFYQFDRSLVAFLDSSKKYQLYFGDSTLALPNYDIESFKDSIHQPIADISIREINRVTNANPQPKIAKKNSKWIMWSCIGIALFILFGMTFKMLKEMDNRNNSDTD